jgi:uncharacterized membrane protein YdjX (TVP38/TMEM64 family)
VWTRWGLVGAALLALILVPFALFGSALDAAVTPWLKAAPADAFALGSAALLAVDFALPVPSSVVATAAGARLGLELGALVVFGGLQLGCAAAWAVGRWIGRPAIDRLVGEPEQQRARSWLCGPGGLAALAACRAVPVLGEATTLLAGSVRLPFARFFAVTAAANAGLGLAYAGLGALSSQTGSIALAGLGAVGLPAIAIVCVSRRAPRRTGASSRQRGQSTSVVGGGTE